MVDVLLLNASYEPLGVISLRRLIGLLTANKVDVVETVADRHLRSARTSQPLPSVVRLRYYVNVPRRGQAWSRRGILDRDHFTCQYCGRKLRGAEATVDHVIPQWICRRDGIPASTWINTVAACPKCQQRKGGRAMHEAGMRFHDPGFEPKTPRTRYLTIAGGRPEWRRYVEV